MIYAIFFLSGVSALIFQHIWFRQAGLMLGNSVLATSLVLSSFMAGLALGNALATFRPFGRRQALVWYAGLEVTVAVTGVGLTFILPLIGTSLVPSLVALAQGGVALGTIRFGLGFVLLVIPTAAMGMTLPLLVGRSESRELFGAALGQLYGWNTLGAVLGALLGEAFLYERMGIRNTAFLAGSLNLIAALVCLGLIARERDLPEASPPEESTAGSWSGNEARLILIAGIAGACLLALEVVWTRFLLLSVFGTALAFAIMLAQALAGIAVGSLLASRAPHLCGSPRAIPALSLLSAMAVTGTYAAFADVLAIDLSAFPPWTRVSVLAGALILPVAMISGALFTSIGIGLAQTRKAASATGVLSLANTLGAMAGALLAGFVLLPRLGMERSFLAIALAYTVAAVLAPGFRRELRQSPVLVGVTTLSLLFTVLFPMGLLERRYLRDALRPYLSGDPETRVSGVREGLTETIVYIDTLFHKETLSTRLFTNSFSMSGTGFTGRRYMETFVYLPVAIHPGIRRALLISYGVGSTARALVDTREIERIDVVDISRDILEMAHLAVPEGGPVPLDDPRVVTHIEDGRFFLQTSEEGYDLITSEPPPPLLGGVVNLYTLEYFQLLRQRLNPGGIVSYWLPVHSLSDDSARAVSSAFCAAFPDCTLWKGVNLDWILLGTRDLAGPVTGDRFRNQWRPGGSGALSDLGLEVPEQLGALFMAEGRGFPDLTGALPVEDNYPGRLSRSPSADHPFGPWRQALMDDRASRERFLKSDFVKKNWPEAMRVDTLPYFAIQRHYDDMTRALIGGYELTSPIMNAVHLLRDTSLTTLPGILLGKTVDIGLLAARPQPRGDTEEDWRQPYLAVADLTARRYEDAVARFREVLATNPSSPGIGERLALALCLSGRVAEADVERARLNLEPESDWSQALAAACAPGSKAPPARPS